MHWRTFKMLLEYLRFEFEISEKDSIHYIDEMPLKQYVYDLDQIKNNIYEAFRNFILENKDTAFVQANLTDAKFKLSDSFSRCFNIRIEEWNRRDTLNFVPKKIRIKHNYTDPLSKALYELAYTAYDVYYYFDTKIKEINNELIKNQENRKTRKKATYQDFYIKGHINNENFKNIYLLMTKDGFIEDTTLENFIKIFTGKRADKALIWKYNIVYLNRFIKNIEGKGLNKMTDGKWEVVSQIFKDKNHQHISPDQLKMPGSTTTKKDLDNVKYLIDEFNSIVVGN